MLNIFFLVALIIGTILYYRKGPQLIGRHFERHYPRYRTYTSEDKKNIIRVAFALIWRGWRGDTFRANKENLNLLISLTEEQHTMIEEAEPQIRKYSYYFIAFVAFTLITFVFLDQINVLPIM